MFMACRFLMEETSSASVSKRKHVTLTLAEKVKIIEDVEAGGCSYETIGKNHGVGAATVARFVKMKDLIRAKVEAYKEHGIENRRTLKKQQYPLLEEVLFLWVLQQREQNIIISPEVLKMKAEVLFSNLQKRGCYVDMKFLVSDGWARRFKQRYGLRVLGTAGEKASADQEAYERFKNVLMQKIIDMKLNKSQLFNADESALFIRLMASRTVALWDERVASGRKLDKTRFTFMPCCNMNGTLKMKLMFIGTSANPRGFERQPKSSLPVCYYHSKKAWMTRELFRNWFYDEFVPAVRMFSEENNLAPTALLILDNCTAHYDGSNTLCTEDGLIQVLYLPPNVTSLCQPMDQSVINAVKVRYKRKLMLKLVLEDEDLPFEQRLRKISLRQSIDWLAASWDEISQSTIENSWKKLIDDFPDFEWSDIEPNDNYAEDIQILVSTIDKTIGTCTSENDIQRWLVDNVLDSEGNTINITSEMITDEELIASVLRGNETLLYNDEEYLESNCTVDEAVQSSSIASEQQEHNFSNVIQSLDNVIQFVENDIADVCKLKTLRSKLIEAEWKRRSM